MSWFRAGTRGRRGVLAILAGTAFGQVLALAASPFLSRLYSPVDFGVFSIINAVAMVLGTVMALRYEFAVPLPVDDDDARALVALGTLVTLVLTALLTVAGLALAPDLARAVHDPDVRPWIVWVPVIAAVLAVFRLLNQWALRLHHYAATARRNVLQATSTVIIQLVWGWRVPGAGGLIAGLGGGQALGALALLRGSGLRSSIGRSDLLRVARRYRSFPLLLAPSGLLNAAGLYLPVLLFSSYFDTEVAGWFGFTQRILALPITLVGQAVAQVYLSELAKARRIASPRQVDLFRVATQRLCLVGAVGAVGLFVLARPVFPLVFGQRWHESGAMAQALAVSLALQFIAAPLSQTLIVYERTGTQLLWDSGRLLVTALSVALPAELGAGALTCVWCLSIASAGAYAVSWWLSSTTVARAQVTDRDSAETT